MYDLLTADSPPRSLPLDAPRSLTRDIAQVSASALARALDVMDYGVLLVLGDCHLVHANQVAHKEFDDLHPLQLFGRELRARRPQDVAPLRLAIGNACDKGLQRLLSIGGDDTERTVLSIVPMPMLGPGGEAGAMLVFAKRRDGADLTTEAFARAHGLTTAEVRVLKQLCEGRRASEIARAQGVALCTVRTQIGSLREKTGSSCIGDLVQRVSRLPPMPVRMAA